MCRLMKSSLSRGTSQFKLGAPFSHAFEFVLDYFYFSVAKSFTFTDISFNFPLLFFHANLWKARHGILRGYTGILIIDQCLYLNFIKNVYHYCILLSSATCRSLQREVCMWYKSLLTPDHYWVEVPAPRKSNQLKQLNCRVNILDKHGKHGWIILCIKFSFFLPDSRNPDLKKLPVIYSPRPVWPT